MTVVLELLGVAVLILLNGFFVAAEYSLVTVRRTRLKELIDEGNRPARAVMKITSDPAHFIAAMQLGVTLTSLAIGAIGEQVLSDLFGVYLGTFLAVVLAFFVITFMHVVVGELVPKGLALSYSERIALGVSVPVRAFFFVAAPLIWVLQRSSEGAQRLIGIDPDYTDGEAHSEAELKMLLEVSTQRGEIEQGEREMLYKVFDFADKEASDVMVPRPEVVGISIEMAPEEALRGGARVALHALPRLPRVARRDRRHPPRPRPRLRPARQRHRRGRAGGALAPGLRRARRRRTWPRCSPSSGARTSTCRSSSTSTARRRASSRSRTCWRRSSARSRTSSTSPTSRSSGSTRRRSGSTARSRSTTSTRSSARRSSTRTSTPSPATSST